MLMINEEKEARDRNSLKQTLKVLRQEERRKERGCRKVKSNSLKTQLTSLGIEPLRGSGEN